jgi:hypothetical protein
VPRYHKEIEKALLREAVLDLFARGLLVHWHDIAVSRYIVLFLELVAPVTKYG